MNATSLLREIELNEEHTASIIYNRLFQYKPYPKQKEFHFARDTLAGIYERMLGAGTQTGKTYAGAREAAYHATGLYPDWWDGDRFLKPTTGWVCGVTGKALRESLQILLLGSVESDELTGTGSIPKHLILNIKKAQGVSGLVDKVTIKHVTGGISTIVLKTYSEGREPFQSATIDWIWFDEEPPEDIYSEGLARTNNGQLGQFAFTTFTPLKGMTTVAHDFYSGNKPQKHLTIMTIFDVDHYTDDEKKAIVAGYPDHERDARSRGIPTVGEGRVFLTPEDEIKHEMQSFPKWWPHIAGQDFGYGQSDSAHPTAIVCMSWDRDRDIIYLYDAFYVHKPTPIKTAGTLRARHPDKIDWIPVAWPHDAMKASGGNEKGTIAELHRNQGMQMLDEHAKFEDGGNSVEAGIMDMDQRMQDGRLKVASHLDEWFKEYRMYHRENGKIVKLRDDLMSGTRYGIMCIRYAETNTVDHDIDFESEF